MAKGLMKVGLIMFYTSIAGLVVGTSLIVIMTCYNVAKYIVTKTFSFLF
jgi:hypothetical protein